MKNKLQSDKAKRNQLVSSKYPQSIEELCDIFPEYVPIYDSRVRHYILRDHTNIVLNQFDRYFSNNFNDKEKELIRFFLIIHDIGKPQAFKEGDKDKQYDHSIKITKDMWFKLPASQKDLNKVLFLMNSDHIGAYFQNKSDVESLSEVISYDSKVLNTKPKELLYYFLVYYQCDTSAYTQDAGGSKFLEHLFFYENGAKVFDREEGILRFSPVYWDKYLKLKREILKCQ